uniref:RNA 3'-terminal phosphate cyclase n=1 Tax=Steinernema glaseri TaxID=37863 RepID=A0A1I8ALD7_9BILA
MLHRQCHCFWVTRSEPQTINCEQRGLMMSVYVTLLASRPDSANRPNEKFNDPSATDAVLLESGEFVKNDFQKRHDQSLRDIVYQHCVSETLCRLVGSNYQSDKLRHRFRLSGLSLLSDKEGSKKTFFAGAATQMPPLLLWVFGQQLSTLVLMSEELVFEGCNYFRQRFVMSMLSGRPVIIKNIRANDEAPGIQDFEAKLISLFENVSNGSKFFISRTGTEVRFQPGSLIGGNLTFDCGTDRCISYFLEPLIMVAPFCKQPLNVKLLGVTNKRDEISVDAMRATWLPVFNKFVINDENLNIKINARGFFPTGGGSVTFTAPIVRTLRPTQRQTAGKIRRIRGVAYVSKASPTIANRMIDAAKKMLRDYIADVYITVDTRKGDAAGRSPGFGIFLTAETTEGVFYHGEAMSKSSSDATDAPSIPEDIGSYAGSQLLNEIYRGGCLDSSAQLLAATFVTLCEKDVSVFLSGPLTHNAIAGMRHLKMFFGMVFNFKQQSLENEDGDEEESLGTGSSNRVVITGMGVGYSNLNKVIL